MRKIWILHWAYQLHYIGKIQKENLLKIATPYESILRKILTKRQLLDIKKLYILQQFLLRLSKYKYLTQTECNKIMQEKVTLLTNQNTCDFSFKMKEHIVEKDLEDIIVDLRENNVLEADEIPIIYEILHEQILATSTKTDFPDNKVGYYEIKEKIGAGGMGVVYKGFDTLNNQIVAIKSIHNRNIRNENALKRFYREMEISASLEHPNLLKIYHFGEVNSAPYLVMEYIEGKPLLQYIEENDISMKQKLLILAKIADALEYAHGKQILHRDIKPSNILVRKDGSPVLMDFGLAKKESMSEKAITQSGEAIGTPQYMSPEQAKGQRHKLDNRTDIYGLGAVLYHILTGNPPAMGDSIISILYQVANKKITFSKEEKKIIPIPLRNICLKSLEKNSQEIFFGNAFKKRYTQLFSK